MAIVIQKPELEAMIQQRMESGAFLSIEDVLLQALKSVSTVSHEVQKPNLADFLMNSPLAGSELIIERSSSVPQSIKL